MREQISKPHSQNPVNIGEPGPRAPVQKMLLAAVAGVVLNGFLRLLQTFAFTSSPLLPSTSAAELFLNVEFQAASTAVLILLAIYRRHQKDGWIFALLAGMGLANIAIYWFKPML